MSQTLYQIDAAILACIDEDGEIFDIEAFDALNLALEDKIDHTACHIKNLKAEIEAIKAERDKLTKRIAAKENLIAGSVKALEYVTGAGKFESARCSVSWRPSECVNVLDESLIPLAYMKEKRMYEPVKSLIKAAIKAGRNVPGAEIEHKNNIQIK